MAAPAAAAPPPPPPKQLAPDDLLGFEQGFARPVERLSQLGDQGLGKLGIDMDTVNRTLGFPTTQETIAADQKRVADAARAGRRPGDLGDFAGGAVATLPLMAESAVARTAGGGAAGWLNSQAPDVWGKGMDAALGAGSALVGPAAVGALSKAVGPKLSNLAASAVRYGGYKPSPGQALGGLQKAVEGATQNVLPHVGNAVNAAADSWDAAMTNFKAAMPDILRDSRIGVDPQWDKDLANISAQVVGLPKRARAAVGPIWTNAQDAVENGLKGSGVTDFFNSLDPAAAGVSKKGAAALTAAREAALDAAQRQNPHLADALRIGRGGAPPPGLPRAKPPASIPWGKLFTGAGGLGLAEHYGVGQLLGPAQHALNAVGAGAVIPAAKVGAGAAGLGLSTIPYAKPVQALLQKWVNPAFLNPGNARMATAAAIRQAAPYAGGAGAVSGQRVLRQRQAQQAQQQLQAQ